MINMRCIFIFGLLAIVQVKCAINKSNDTLEASNKKMVASVKEFPTMVHRCSATFLTPDILLTTATCVYCETHCQLFTYALADHLTPDESKQKGVLVNVSKTIVHPYYEKDPAKNNIGLMKLTEKVKHAVVAKLPTIEQDLVGILVDSYKWRFTKDLQDYYLQIDNEKTISRALCTVVHENYIDIQQICTRRNNYTTTGLFDRGCPIITRSDGVVLGIRTSQDQAREAKIEVYQSVLPFVEWIKKMIKCNFECYNPDSVIPIESSTTNSNTVAPEPIVLSTTKPPPSSTEGDLIFNFSNM